MNNLFEFPDVNKSDIDSDDEKDPGVEDDTDAGAADDGGDTLRISCQSGRK
jgi:hypothetical protein